MTTTSSPEVGLAGLRAELDFSDATSLHAPRTRTDIRVRGARQTREHGAAGPFTRRGQRPITEQTSAVEEFVTDLPDTHGRRPAWDVAS
ncbi:hypothetical protein [Streptomyces hilarionis]|uniref:hypothetical protein n=1 Tax=Streptomyces hilarionis TaxID=2839954 RepID=UPI00211A4E50|nr:hypothetical protein [Streptomyces hilarionis]MCQ9131386.1 hypothetical protein [Streptomyces hilarionis]